MQPSYEIFDHTADAGIRIRAATLPELIPPATEGFYACIGEIAVDGEPEVFEFDRPDSNADPATLLRDYLQELLLLFETKQRRVTSIAVAAFTPKRLAVTCETALVDPARSVYYREVKAITYHELAIQAIAGGYEATIIVDI